MHVQSCHHLVSLLVIEQRLLGMVPAVAKQLAAFEKWVGRLVVFVAVSLSVEEFVVVASQKSR